MACNTCTCMVGVRIEAPDVIGFVDLIVISAPFHLVPFTTFLNGGNWLPLGAG